MAKQTKITIVLDQPLNDYAEEIGRDLLGSRHCFGVYSSFDQSRVTYEEIDTTVNEQAKIIPFDFIKWYSGMTDDQIQRAFKRYNREKKTLE